MWSSLDVAYASDGCWGWGCNTPSVTAAHSGKVANWPYSKCAMRIIDASGWQTSYYHMDKLTVKPGDNVKEGQIIGIYANNIEAALCDGGQSTGPHLHFTLRNKGGKQVNLDGWLISGYRVTAGNKDYDTDCSRCYFKKDGRKYCPNKDRMTNNGGGGGDCTDKHPNDCPGWITYCNTYVNWMAKNCKKSCGKCESTGTNLGCSDALPGDYDSTCSWTCVEWANYGYCNKDWSSYRHCVPSTSGPIKNSCKKSCNQCG